MYTKDYSVFLWHKPGVTQLTFLLRRHLGNPLRVWVQHICHCVCHTLLSQCVQLPQWHSCLRCAAQEFKVGQLSQHCTREARVASMQNLRHVWPRGK